MRPVLMQWDGEVMRPVGRGLQLATEQYVPGERYMLEPLDARSLAEHRHYFAWLNEAWANLPEQWGNRWTNPEQLRKWALNQTPFCTTTVHRTASVAEAKNLVRYLLVVDDELEIERIGRRVIVKKADSQNFQSMSKKKFRESKEAVMAVVAMLIGVTPQTLKRESLRHA
jgi:hypothetical protein